MIRSRHVSKRSALTLLELVTVLVILVALAGIVVPMVANLQSQARYSTAGTNLSEMARLVSAYQSKFGFYPDGWDTLTVGTALATYLPGNETGTGSLLSNYLTTSTAIAPGSALAVPLTNVGIVNFYPFVAAPANPTFYPYGIAETTTTGGTTLPNIPTPVSLNAASANAGSVTLAQLTSLGAQKLNLPNSLGPANPTAATPVYVVLGLGSRNSMIPKTILDAPVRTADNGVSGPNSLYCRFGVVFQITDSTAALNPLTAAILVGVVDFSDEQGLVTLGNEIENFYNSVKNAQ